MRKPILLPGFLCLLASCGSPQIDLEKTPETQIPTAPKLVVFYDENENSGYLNEQGDTVAPIGKYAFIFTDTIDQIGFVANSEGKILCLNNLGEELFETYNFDNGPDYVEDGLFRILENGKIGYADEAGNIVIAPQFTCAYPFENGRAQVSLNCVETTEFEMTKWESNEWFYIDKTGQTITE